MFYTFPNREQLDYAEELVNHFNFGHRGYGDGNRRKRKVGILGQIYFGFAILNPFFYLAWCKYLFAMKTPTSITFFYLCSIID